MKVTVTVTVTMRPRSRKKLPQQQQQHKTVHTFMALLRAATHKFSPKSTMLHIYRKNPINSEFQKKVKRGKMKFIQ